MNIDNLELGRMNYSSQKLNSDSTFILVQFENYCLIKFQYFFKILVFESYCMSYLRGI